MKDIEQRKSPLQIKMDELGKKLSIFSFAVIACIMALGIFQGKTFLSMFNIGALIMYQNVIFEIVFFYLSIYLVINLFIWLFIFLFIQ